MRLPLALTLTLVACANTTPVSPLLTSYRDASVPIASKADFEPARFAGRWYEVASYPVPFQRDCAGATADYAPQPDGTIALRNTCLDADGRAKRSIDGVATPTGPGRLRVRLDGVPFGAPLWVLWTDADYRFAVLGQPDGRAGWILSRERTVRPDLSRAAREVLDFNGYDVSRLRDSTPR